MSELDRGAVAREFGALARDVDTVAAALTDMRSRLLRLQTLFDTPSTTLEATVAAPGPPPRPTPEEQPSPRPSTTEVAPVEPTTPALPDPANVPADHPGPDAAHQLPTFLPDLPEIEPPALYPWQRDALEAWRAAGQTGVVEAVTGAGKTRVGLGALADALMDGRRVVVMTPTQGLVAQWEKQVRDLLPGVLVSTDATRSPGWHVLVDTVHTLAQRDPLWPGEEALLVADEAHRYGAPTFAQALRGSYTHRLGLSATFERGDDGDALLDPYFHGVCFRLGYDRALADGLIAGFRVALLGVPLSPPERDEYDAASEGIRRSWQVLAADLGGDAGFSAVLVHATRISAQRDHRLASSARTFLGAFAKRRDVLARVSAKVSALELLAPAVATSGGTIVFTGTTESARRAAQTLQEAGCESAAVHGQLGQDEVEERLELLRSGQTRSITAPRILDEGVDVPDADLGIILAASKSRRQMIQRLGRVVRRKPDGRSARLVVLYAIGTSEDPGVEAVPPHLEEIITHAQASTRLTLPQEAQDALSFLWG